MSKAREIILFLSNDNGIVLFWVAGDNPPAEEEEEEEDMLLSKPPFFGVLPKALPSTVEALDEFRVNTLPPPMLC